MPGREYACDESLVCLAASYGDAQALALLYSFGANLNETQMQGLTKESSLETSASFGHVDVVDFLLQHGAYWGRALHYAAKGGHERIVELLLADGASPLVRVDGNSPLRLAVMASHSKVTERLLRAGARLEDSLHVGL